jgi:hypothetical protein
MKNYSRILVAIVFLLGVGVTAKAQTRELIVVKLPFQSTVKGGTLPAGTYTVSRLSNDDSGPLVFTNHESGTSVFVLPAVHESAFGDKPQVSFQRVAGEQFLTTIETGTYTYYFPISHSAILEAVAKSHNSVSASGGSD